MFKVLSRDSFWDKIQSTSRMGEIDLVYADIEKALGKPFESDEYKVSGEWVFYNEETGEAYTLYDWKSTDLYDSGYPTVEQFRANPDPQQFNIGGNHKGDVEEFKRQLLAHIQWVKNGGREAELALLGKAIPIIQIEEG